MRGSNYNMKFTDLNAIFNANLYAVQFEGDERVKNSLEGLVLASCTFGSSVSMNPSQREQYSSFVEAIPLVNNMMPTPKMIAAMEALKNSITKTSEYTKSK